jgi:hypothetical protein
MSASMRRWLAIGSIYIFVFCCGCGRSSFDIGADVKLDAAVDAVLVDATPDRPNVAFITSSRHDGARTGPSVADEICQTRAKEGRLTGNFRAWLSGPTWPTNLLEGSSGWILPSGKWLAFTPAQVDKGEFYHPLLEDQNKEVSVAGVVWSGKAAASCNDWNSNSPIVEGAFESLVEWGYPNDRTAPCNATKQIACFEIGHNAARPVPPLTGANLVFVSKALWGPNVGGRSNADKTCDDEAKKAGRSGTFIALLPAGTARAVDRIAGAEMYQRTDGELIGPFNAPLQTFIMLDADGNPIPTASHVVWTGGDPNTPALATATCNDWTSTAATDFGIVGNAGYASTLGFYDGDDSVKSNCTMTRRLYCVQQ